MGGRSGGDSSVPVVGADRMQQRVDGRINQPIPHQPTLPCRLDPPLLPQQPQRLRQRSRPHPHSGREVGDTQVRLVVQLVQDLQSIRVGQEIEPAGPLLEVMVGAATVRVGILGAP